MYSAEVTRSIAEGAKFYSAKEYEAAGLSYADACAAFKEEHARDDPDLLLLYGKALFQNGLATSTLLGGVTGTDEDAGEKEEDENGENDGFTFHEGFAEEEGNDSEEGENAEESANGEIEENDEDNDEEDGQNAPEEEEQSEFEVAWDVLELARGLFEEMIENFADSEKALEPPYLASPDAAPQNTYVETLKKLSETYDLLGEVSLETENFTQAAVDLQSCLELRQKLYDSTKVSLISETHYKLSLALEFCIEDPKLRARAADHMKLAVQIVRKQVEALPEGAEKTDKLEILPDLEERFQELQREPVQEVEAEQLDMIKGLLGEAVAGSSKNELLEAVPQKLPVNDLSSMVKKRKAKPEQSDQKKARKE